MKKLFIGIPVLNRMDLLRRCVEGVDRPAEIVIVNNDTVDAAANAELAALVAEHDEIAVLPQRRNLGVARGYDWIVIGSNDAFLHQGSLHAAADIPKREGVAIYFLCDFNFFMICAHTIEKVGWFDENFYPAYMEDSDYLYRIRLAGMRTENIRGARADHLGSATK